jgi:hypothetical protein
VSHIVCRAAFQVNELLTAGWEAGSVVYAAWLQLRHAGACVLACPTRSAPTLSNLPRCITPSLNLLTPLLAYLLTYLLTHSLTLHTGHQQCQGAGPDL